MIYSIVANNCTAGKVYANFFKEKNPLFIEYTTPFVASLFIDDLQYIKFCENYDHYTSAPPQFGPPRKSRWEEYTGKKTFGPYGHQCAYPVMYLDDIDIHWAHETDEKLLMKKYKGRLELSKEYEPLFIFSLSHLLCIYPEDVIDEMVARFMSLDHKSIMLSPYKRHAFDTSNNICQYMSAWGDKSLSNPAERYQSGAREYMLKWADTYAVVDTFTDIIKQRFLK